MKIMLKVLNNKSPQNLHTALVHQNEQGPDEIRRLTEQDFTRMMKLQRKIWSVRSLRWYQTLPRELHRMKPWTAAWKNRVVKWAKAVVRGKNGDKIFWGMVTVGGGGRWSRAWTRVWIKYRVPRHSSRIWRQQIHKKDCQLWTSMSRNGWKNN